MADDLGKEVHGIRRKTVLVSLGLFLVFLGASIGTLCVLIKHEPDFYTSRDNARRRGSHLQSGEFLNRFLNLQNSIEIAIPIGGKCLRRNNLTRFCSTTT